MTARIETRRYVDRGRAQWWMLLAVALLLVIVWPSDNDRSLAMKVINWAVDPADDLPTLPGPLAFGQGDDLAAVNAHDLQTRMYDELTPSTERQVLVAIAVVAGFVVWRVGARPGSGRTGDVNAG